MISDSVIKEIYKRFGKKKQNIEENLGYFVDILSEHHDIKVFDDEIIIDQLEEFNPFRRFLKRNLHAIIEFDKEVAFVFPSHILFLNRESPNIRIHMRLEEERSFLSRLFGRR